MNRKQLSGVSQSFLDRANSAAFYEAWVGSVLARAGLYTLHHPFVADGGDYHGTTWDLDVAPNEEAMWGPGMSGKCVQVECKSLSLAFNSPGSYPYENVLLCSQNSWLKKWPGKDKVQRDFLLISRPTGSIVWVPCGVPVSMGVEVTDKTRGETFKAVSVRREALLPLGDFLEMVNR